MSRLRPTVLALRPYSRRIRSKVFPALKAIGADVEVAVEAGASDHEAVAAIRDAPADALLIPFHAHRDSAGVLVHGLGLIERIRRDARLHQRTPVLCPISNVGLAAAGLMAARDDGPSMERVLLIYEDDLDDADVPGLVGGFLQRHGVFFAGRSSRL